MTHTSSPRRGELLTIAIFAVALRIGVFLIAMLHGHLNLPQYTAKGDTSSYLANAAVISGERPLASLTDYDVRVFPGYPVMIAIVHRLWIPLPVAALFVTWLSAAIAAAAAGKVFADVRVAWAMTCLIPHYLINSSLGMSEAPLLAMVCLALLASQYDQILLAGVLFGCAGMIRPMACFALAGVVFALLRDRRTKPAIVLLIATAGMFALELLAIRQWTGDALRSVHAYSQNPDAYAGHLLALPFQSLLTTPAHDRVGVGRVIYIWLHVIITLLACGLIADRVIRAGRSKPRDAVACAWLIGNTAFVLCIGSVWGFRHFPRFTIPAAPAFFWTVRNVLPRGPIWWSVIGALCAVMAVFGVIASP